MLSLERETEELEKGPLGSQLCQPLSCSKITVNRDLMGLIDLLNAKQNLTGLVNYNIEQKVKTCTYFHDSRCH